ncbi:MAG: hypothetical protein AABZ74_03640 [Cyanobacteriota bacterium]
MRKLLFKNKKYENPSILEIFSDEEYSNIVKVNLFQEIHFSRLKKNDLDSYIEAKIKKGWKDSEKDKKVILDPIFGLILIDKHGNLSSSKYIDIFKSYVNIELGNLENNNLEISIKKYRVLFCEFINKQEELKNILLPYIYKYAKKKYKEILEYYEDEQLKIVKKSLKTESGVFDNLIKITNIDFNIDFKYDNSFILSFDCDWDEEHGMGISINNWEIKNIGGAGDVWF